MKFIGTGTRLTVQASALVMTLEQLTEMSSIPLTWIEENYRVRWLEMYSIYCFPVRITF